MLLVACIELGARPDTPIALSWRTRWRNTENCEYSPILRAFELHSSPILPIEGHQKRLRVEGAARNLGAERVVRRLGLEPRTNWLKANCSTN